jgi:2-phosphoglycerate kinase
MEPWAVLVLLGASGTGKSTAAADIARQRGATWMQVDDLRLALQSRRVSLPEHTERLYAFLDDPGIWSRSVVDVRGAFIGVAQAMAPAVRIVIENHVATDDPMVIEGDGVLPALVGDEALAPVVASGIVRFCCLAEDGADALLANMLARGRGITREVTERSRVHAAANAAFGAWLAAESRRLGIPVVASRPFETLPRRILAAAHGQH